MMAIRERTEDEPVRLRVVLAAMLVLLLTLAGTLFRFQVVHGPAYEQSLKDQSLRRIRLPAVRGRICDRNGVCLADSRPSCCLVLYLEELRRPGKWQNTIDEVQKVIRPIAGIIGRPPEVTEDDIRAHIRKRLPLPLTVWRDLDDGALARLAESEALLTQVNVVPASAPASGSADALSRSLPLPKGMDVTVEWVRYYPSNSLAAHVLGYVGRADPAKDSDSQPSHYYLPEWEGRTGIERRMDSALQGTPGSEVVRIDASGYRFVRLRDQEAVARAVWVKDPEPGADVLLAVDTRIQRFAEEALGGATGAVVVVDVQNGDVLALASAPAFNPNQFIPVLSAPLWDALCTDPAHPLVDRAIAGAYAPGSVFKPLTALAALQSGAATADTAFSCPGYYERGSFKLRCWYAPGHGTLRMVKAIEQSCNTYFASLGVLCGFDPIHDTAVRAGIGRRTGIELDGEVSGFMPAPAWKRRRLRDDWRFGDTCNVSIGQGAVAVTPLQMALVTAAIANGGRLFGPRLVLGVQPHGAPVVARPAAQATDLGWSPAALRVLRQGMHDVVMAETGTGIRARIPGVEMAGKTGTAEYGSKTQGRKHGWMIAYAPFDRPRVAVAMVLDDADSGGRSVAPRIHLLMNGLFHEGGLGG